MRVLFVTCDIDTSDSGARLLAIQFRVEQSATKPTLLKYSDGVSSTLSESLTDLYAQFQQCDVVVMHNACFIQRVLDEACRCYKPLVDPAFVWHDSSIDDDDDEVNEFYRKTFCTMVREGVAPLMSNGRGQAMPALYRSLCTPHQNEAALPNVEMLSRIYWALMHAPPETPMTVTQVKQYLMEHAPPCDFTTYNINQLSAEDCLVPYLAQFIRHQHFLPRSKFDRGEFRYTARSMCPWLVDVADEEDEDAYESYHSSGMSHEDWNEYQAFSQCSSQEGWSEQ